MRAAKNYPTAKRRADASDTRIGNLIFEHGQRTLWAALAIQAGRTSEAAAHYRKAKGARTALRTLGYKGDL